MHQSFLLVPYPPYRSRWHWNHSVVLLAPVRPSTPLPAPYHGLRTFPQPTFQSQPTPYAARPVWYQRGVAIPLLLYRPHRSSAWWDQGLEQCRWRFSPLAYLVVPPRSVVGDNRQEVVKQPTNSNHDATRQHPQKLRRPSRTFRTVLAGDPILHRRFHFRYILVNRFQFVSQCLNIGCKPFNPILQELAPFGCPPILLLPVALEGIYLRGQPGYHAAKAVVIVVIFRIIAHCVPHSLEFLCGAL